MSERLKEIEDSFNSTEWFEGFNLSASDIEWLIEQAEKVEELKEINRDLNREVGKYTSRLFSIAQTNYDSAHKIEKLINDMLQS